jgi:hypothetical protein
MSLTDDPRKFAVVHRGHGTVTYTASAETESGYDPRFRCTCRQSYYVHVTPEIAAEDFLAQAERNRCQGTAAGRRSTPRSGSASSPNHRPCPRSRR